MLTGIPDCGQHVAYVGGVMDGQDYRRVVIASDLPCAVHMNVPGKGVDSYELVAGPANTLVYRCTTA